MFRVGEIGQWVGMAASLGGLIVEVLAGADIGFALITAGSLVWAIATKLKYHRGKKRGGYDVINRVRGKAKR